jgi:tRNA G10  N-methylase Trm11
MKTEDIILSARTGTNDELFAAVMQLHVPAGVTVADVTWGRGAFWKRVPKDRYIVKATDIQTGTDLRKLPYAKESIDCVILDPPYMGGFYRPANRKTPVGPQYNIRYSNGGHTDCGTHTYHRAVREIYRLGGEEAKRVLRPKGILIVKTQDEVSSSRQCLTHVEIINDYAQMGYYCKDLFVLVSRDRKHGKRTKKQEHARKNHSYFLVFVLNNQKPDNVRISDPATR